MFDISEPMNLSANTMHPRATSPDTATAATESLAMLAELDFIVTISLIIFSISMN